MKPLSATQAVAAIEAGTLTSEKLVRDCLERIAEREPVVKAWAFLNPDLAIAQAKAADIIREGVLRGVPIGVKDIIDTHDMPTGHNSPIFEGKVPFGDAACVALCRTANAVIMGKTVTTEFANRHPGPTTNPHNSGHTPGGSSSGSAAAVADGHVPLAFGTQTGGSVIRPAAYCGVIGYKPTFGDFSRVGIKMQCHSLDTLGLMARTLDDIALFRGAVLKLPPVAIDRAIARPRIGFCRTPIWGEASADTKALLEATATTLSDKRASVVDVAFAPAFV
ncbi:MAG TPA: amidase, partial [Dongiaceae bacterium]|nr:amidase [Dongiaceae bacterium]